MVSYRHPPCAQLLANKSDYEYPVLSGARCLGEPREILFMMLLVQAIVGLIMLAFVPMPGAIAARLCAEKESRMKQLLLVLGMSPHAFWCVLLLYSMLRPNDSSAHLHVKYLNINILPTIEHHYKQHVKYKNGCHSNDRENF